MGSVAFHALLVALFVLDLARGPVAAPEPPAMTVFLDRAPPPARPRPSSRGGPRAPSATVKAEPAPAAPIAAPAGPASPSSSEGAAVAEASAADLRGLGGCRLATLDRLSADQRARCQERLAQAMDKGRATRPNLDPTGRFARDARPYLTRPPENGCKPVGSIKPGLMGSTDATLGLGCAKSF
ncbi:hypothetical protein CSW62_19745 [Caulobacter sp. FWC2]|nr:hypothetical protein CSW62_19745 [Caulobacter sp. FWC2]